MRDENGKVICDAHFFGTLVPFDSQISDGNGSNPMPKIGFYDYLTFATIAIVGIGFIIFVVFLLGLPDAALFSLAC